MITTIDEAILYEIVTVRWWLVALIPDAVLLRFLIWNARRKFDAVQQHQALMPIMCNPELTEQEKKRRVLEWLKSKKFLTANT